jgi:hypothetical protein
MGVHNLTELEAVRETVKALDERQRKYGKFNAGDKVVLEKEKKGWHSYYECSVKEVKVH